MGKLAIIILMALFVGSIASSMAAQRVIVSGSSTVLPLAEAAAEVFNAEQNDYRVSVTGGGTGAGIINIVEGRSDLAMASRDVTEDEKRQYRNRFQDFIIGYDGIVLAVSRPIYDAGVRGLTKDQVDKIYTGNISNWKEVGGPHSEILVIGREESSGTRDTFTEIILGDKKAEAPAVNIRAMGSAEVKTALAGSDKGIGYLGLNYLGGDKIRGLKLDCVEPTIESIKDGSYMLARKLSFVTFGKPIPGARAFIDFINGAKGRKIAEENGFIPP
ncbi:MAG: phosphate ABC transporter substrate-binding protein [Methanotrichaceae archaeon]|nr:phosphate ABC transporter substrate-binding protein [Methanotrichaceae archaeon]